MSSNWYNFCFVQTLPKLEGFIRHLPKTVYAGDLRHLDLVLRNPSEISVKVFYYSSVSNIGSLMHFDSQTFSIKLLIPSGVLSILESSWPAQVDQARLSVTD